MKNVFALPLLFCLVGCVQSIHPFYTDAQVTFDPSIKGAWADKDQKNTLDISPDPDQKQYKVAYTDEKNKVGHFIVHLATVDGHVIADIYPDELKTDDNDEYKSALLPVHAFCIVDQTNPTLKIRVMSYDWFKKYVPDHADEVKFEQPDGDRVLLTGSTEQVQGFVLHHLGTPDAYGEATEFTRQAAPATAASKAAK